MGDLGAVVLTLFRAEGLAGGGEAETEAEAGAAEAEATMAAADLESMKIEALVRCREKREGGGPPVGEALLLESEDTGEAAGTAVGKLGARGTSGEWGVGGEHEGDAAATAAL